MSKAKKLLIGSGISVPSVLFTFSPHKCFLTTKVALPFR
jgi:hypothetical protein